VCILKNEEVWTVATQRRAVRVLTVVNVFSHCYSGLNIAYRDAMYLHPNRVSHLQRVMELFAARPKADELRTELGKPLLGLLNADFYASYVWDEETRRFGQGVVYNVDLVHKDQYEDCYQFNDPLTPALKARRIPTRVTDVVTQRALVSTAFFDEFLKPAGMYWGMNAYAHDGGRDVGDLRIWRSRSKSNFDATDLSLLQMLYPALVCALKFVGPSVEKVGLPASGDLISLLLERSELSPREAQVSVLVYEGRSDKDIARLLNIGFTTVRTHLVSSFRKLDCAGRTQLGHRMAQIVLQ